MNQLQEEFYQVMTNLRMRGSRAASTPDARVTEMINGVLVSKPAKKVEYIGETTETETQTEKNESEPEITILNDSWEREREKSKASVPGINKLKAIHDFINRRY